MSPTAAALAVLLHVATALALWWVSPLNQRDNHEQEPIEVTIEPPKVTEPVPPTPPDKPPAPTAKPAPPPPPAAAPPTPQGLTPPAPTKGDKNEQVGPRGEMTIDQQTPKAEAKPTEPAPLPEPQPQQQAVAPPPPPEPPIEKALPPLEAPPPPVTSSDFPKLPAPPAPKAELPKPQVRPAPVPPAPQPVKPSPLQSSPLQATPNKRAPSPNDNQASTTFVNPAAHFAQSKLADDYIWNVVRKFSQYLPNLRERGEGGSLALRFVIARDGRLIDVSIARSSGVAALDRGMLEAVRAAAPYPPFPPEMTSPELNYTLPMAAREGR
jgi:TonB family protein